jgi:hypothetical protein
MGIPASRRTIISIDSMISASTVTLLNVFSFYICVYFNHLSFIFEKNETSLVRNKEKYIYLELIKIEIQENTFKWL